jgi:hypothetical protein
MHCLPSPKCLLLCSLGAILLAFTGCGPVSLDSHQGTGVSMTLRLSNQSDVASIRFFFKRVSCSGESIEPFTLTTERVLEDILLPGGIPEFEDSPLHGGSAHAFADLFVDLAPGCYQVSTQPLATEGTASQSCASASSASVRIFDGQTTEILLIHQCKGDGRGAADVIAALNHPPALTSLTFEQSKFVLRCEEQRVCATMRDPDADPIEFSWQQINGPPLYQGPEVIKSQLNSDGSMTECIRMVADTSGRYELTVVAFDLLRDPDSGQLIRFEEYYARQGNPQQSRTTLSFPFYAAEGNGGACRASCTHPSIETLTAYDPSGVTDIVFDPECNAYVSTTISGQDYVYRIDASGSVQIISGYSNFNIGAIALEPTSKQIFVSHQINDPGGRIASIGAAFNSKIAHLTDGLYTESGLWNNLYLNWCASSIAVDDAGCIWTPNFAGNGTLVCVELATGNQRTVTSFPKRPESVAWAAGVGLLVSVGTDIFSVNTQTGATTLRYTAPAAILDFAIDANGDLYVETTAGQILRVTATQGASLFATVSGQGKLAISPDGFLVHVIPAPTSPASYQEWPL